MPSQYMIAVRRFLVRVEDMRPVGLRFDIWGWTARRNGAKRCRAICHMYPRVSENRILSRSVVIVGSANTGCMTVRSSATTAALIAEGSTAYISMMTGIAFLPIYTSTKHKMSDGSHSVPITSRRIGARRKCPRHFTVTRAAFCRERHLA